VSHWTEPRLPKPAKPLRILVVDDNSPFAEALALTLGTIDGFDVVGHARDGAEALEAAHGLHPDVVLMDLQMPVVDGIEATRRLGSQLPCAAVVAVSGAAGGADVERAFEAGAAAFVRKGTPLHDLARTIVEVARRSPLFPRRPLLDAAECSSAA
jgi:NarL family two-component system response regulator LiaR